MHEEHDRPAGDVALIQHEQRIWAIITYVLHLFGAVLALPSILGLIMNYVLRDNALPATRSHHDWMIRTFWWTLGWTVLSILLWVTVILIPLAWLLGVGIWLWWMYRHIRGLIRLADHQPMPY